MTEGPRTGVIEHRRDVLERLLEAGVPATVLEALLPDWRSMIVDASGGRCADEDAAADRAPR